MGFYCSQGIDDKRLWSYASDLVENLLIKQKVDIHSIDPASDEIHLVYHYWDEGKKMETTLVITSIMSEEINDRPL